MNLALHAADVTRALRGEEPPLGLAPGEAVCPVCAMAHLEAAGGWGVCRDCLKAAIEATANEPSLF